MKTINLSLTRIAIIAVLTLTGCTTSFNDAKKGFTISGSFTPDAATQGQIAGAIVGKALGSTAGFRK